MKNLSEPVIHVLKRVIHVKEKMYYSVNVLHGTCRILDSVSSCSHFTTEENEAMTGSAIYPRPTSSQRLCFFSNISLCPSKEIHLLKCGRVRTHKKRVTHVCQVQQAHFPSMAPRITSQHTKAGHKYGQCKRCLLCYYLRRASWCSLARSPQRLC